MSRRTSLEVIEKIRDDMGRSTDHGLAESLGVSEATVKRYRRQFALEERLDSAVNGVTGMEKAYDVSPMEAITSIRKKAHRIFDTSGDPNLAAIAINAAKIEIQHFDERQIDDLDTLSPQEVQEIVLRDLQFLIEQRLMDTDAVTSAIGEYGKTIEGIARLDSKESDQVLQAASAAITHIEV